MKGNRENQALIADALRRSAHVIAEDPSQLPGQVISRLGGIKTASMQALVRQATSLTSWTWLRPLTTSSVSVGNSLLRTLDGHSGRVNSVTVTPDGARVISASDDSTLKIWRLQNGEILQSLEGHTGKVRAVAMMADGQRVISGSDDKTLKIWDLETGRSLQTLEGHSGSVSCIAPTASGRRAVSGSESDGTLKVWDLSTGEGVDLLDQFAGKVRAVAISPDGCNLFAAVGHTLRVWDLADDECICELESHKWLNPYSVVIVATPSGRLAVSAWESSIHVWNLETGDDHRWLKGHATPIACVAATSDGRRVFSCSDDGIVNVWDLDHGEVLQTFEGHSGPVNDLAITPDGRRAISASSDWTLKVWDIDNGEAVGAKLPHAATSLTATLGDSYYRRSYDFDKRSVNKDEIVSPVGSSRGLNCMAVTPDGRQLIVGCEDHTVQVRDRETGEVVRRLEGHSGPVNGVAVTSDGRRVVSVGSGFAIRAWDLESGSPTLKFHNQVSSDVVSVALTPDDRYAISTSWDVAKMWDLDAGELACDLVGPRSRIHFNDVAVTNDGRYAVIASSDKALSVIDLNSREVLHRLEGHLSGVMAVAVTPDSQFAVSASADKTLKIWNLATGDVVRTLSGHARAASCIAVTPDGQHAVSSADDGLLKVWNLQDGRCEASFKIDSAFLCCTVSPDGSTFLGGDATGFVHQLRLESQP